LPCPIFIRTKQKQGIPLGAKISVTETAAKTRDKERIVGTYFWPPSYLMPLVEVAGGRETLKEVMEYTCNI
jgi:3-hydroxyacyl-CoA dehydrogenase